MKKLVLAAAAASVLCGAPLMASAADADELGEIRQQLQRLMQRVDRLEQENTRLQSENVELKQRTQALDEQGVALQAQTQALDAQVVQQTSAGSSADWTSKVSLKGDLRYRHEMISDDAASADRNRDRIRARINLEARATDTLKLGFGLATSENGDPRSTNQSLTNAFSRKSLDLDLAYFDWQFASWGALVGGKMKQPFFKPAGSLFWDGDINPEGLAVNFGSGGFFGTAYNYWINESSSRADTQLAGVQLGLKLPVGDGGLKLAAHYYDLSAGQGRAPFYSGNPNNNSVVNIGGNNVLLYDYQVINLGAELATQLGALPLLLWLDAAQNLDADAEDTAWALGAMLGKAAAPGEWEVGLAYQVVEKDALFAQLIDSDFAGGDADNQGWVLKAAYAPMRNMTLNATYFLNTRFANVTSAAGLRDIDYDRLQLDLNVKF